MLLETSSQKGIESFYDLLSSTLNRVLPVELRVLLYDSSEQHHAHSVWLRNDPADIIQQTVAGSVGNAPPKTGTSAHLRGVKVYRWR
ncbi:MAG: hypothetical protein QOE68_4599 [Thermoanaerobaculia bacterium]|nr:hypothetical protein [Thermoanaerobaculia bacterium]